MQNEDEHSRSMIRCEACGTATPAYDTVNFGSIENGYRQLCSRCFNAEVASLQGLEDFENFRFDQVAMTDCAGIAHEFHFRTRLLGSMVAVRERIESDATEDGRVPLLVIDGREVSWEDFGQMLMTFEGWQFRLEIGDRSDEL
jgi:hypothetical protein